MSNLNSRNQKPLRATKKGKKSYHDHRAFLSNHFLRACFKKDEKNNKNVYKVIVKLKMICYSQMVRYNKNINLPVCIRHSNVFLVLLPVLWYQNKLHAATCCRLHIKSSDHHPEMKVSANTVILSMGIHPSQQSRQKCITLLLFWAFRFRG